MNSIQKPKYQKQGTEHQAESNSTPTRKKRDDGTIGFSGPRVEKGFEVQLYYAAAIMEVFLQLKHILVPNSFRAYDKSKIKMLN